MDDSEKNFFAEVDKKRQSVAPAWVTLATILLLIFGLGVFGLIEVRKAFRNLSFEGWSLDSNLPQVSLGSKISELSKNGSGFEIEMNSIELSAYLNLADDSFPLRNTYAKIRPDQVVIYGRLKSSRFGLPASITLKPEVADGYLRFVSQSTEMERIYMTEETQNKIASAISNRISFDLNMSGKTKVSSVVAQEDKLIVNIVPK